MGALLTEGTVVGNVVRPIGFALAGFAVVVAVLSRLVLPDPWLLMTCAAPLAAGLLIATGLIRPSRPVQVLGFVSALAGAALIALGLFALATSEYGPLAAMFVVPPGVALLAIGLALIAVWRSRRDVVPVPAAPEPVIRP